MVMNTFGLSMSDYNALLQAYKVFKKKYQPSQDKISNLITKYNLSYEDADIFLRLWNSPSRDNLSTYSLLNHINK